MLDRKTPPPIKDAVEFDYVLPACQKYKLQNGINVYAVNTGTQEVFSLELVFDSGTWNEEKTGVGRAVAALLKNGTSTKTAYEINSFFEFYGAQIKSNVSADFFSVSLTGMSKFATVLIDTVLEILTEASFPEHELEIYKKNAIEGLKINLKKCDFVANRLIDEYVFGLSHPYGKYTEIADIEAIQRDDILKYKNYNLGYANCTIFLAGKFEEDVIQKVQNTFGNSKWNTNDSFEKKIYETNPASQKIYNVELDKESVQGAIRIASPFINKHHEDFPKMIVLNTLFGGYFGSRLMSNIREEKGYTYGIHSYIYNNQKQSAFTITTEAGKDVCSATINEVYKEMELLKTEKVDEEELSLVKNYLLGNILGDLDGPFQIIQRWKNIVLSGYEETKFNSNIEIYKTITAEELQALANKYFIKENFYELVVS